jgi:hypothetical protein
VSDLFEPDVLDSLLRQWFRSLRARNRSGRTIETYTDTAEHLAAFAREHDHADLDRALIEDYLADLADRWKPGTVAFRYRSLQQFTKWLAAEGELDADPMEGMRAPHVPEEPVPILTPDDPHRENLGQPGPAPGQLQCPALLTQGQQQVPDQHRPRCPGRGRADRTPAATSCTADGATSRRGAERRVLEHAGLVLDQLDTAVEGAVLDHLEGDVRVAVVDAFCARGPGDHREHHDSEAVDESGS